MAKGSLKIAVVAPGSPIDAEMARRVEALAAAIRPDLTLAFHPQCFLSWGHFAGTDEERAAAFVEAANDPATDAVWFARGGYGANRLLDLAISKLSAAAREKTYLGYSDSGFLLAALYKSGFPRLAHGPMVSDIRREGGGAAIARALNYIAGDRADVEASIRSAPALAFNLTILSTLIGTPWMPELAGHVLMLEEVSEHMYRIDRSFFHLTSNAAIRRVAGIRLGRCSDILLNERAFEQTEEQVARHWCARAGIPYLGRADIGHDIANKIVPFGPPPAA